VECSAADVTPHSRERLRIQRETGALPSTREWSQSVKTIIKLSCGRAEEASARTCAEIQFVAAFPLPLDLDVAAANENASSASLAQDIRDQVATLMPEQTEAESPAHYPAPSSAFLPVVENIGSSCLLQSLEAAGRCVGGNARSGRADARRACERP